MMLKIVTVLMTSLLVAATSMARAQTLSLDEVERFVDATRALLADESFTEHLMTAWQDLEGERQFPGSLMPSELVAVLQGRKGQSLFEATINQYGFEAAADWARSGDLALLALISLDMAGSEQAMQSHLQRMRHQLNSELPISEQQRQRILAMIRHTGQLLEQVSEVPDAHRDVVRPHADRLRQALNYYRN